MSKNSPRLINVVEIVTATEQYTVAHLSDKMDLCILSSHCRNLSLHSILTKERMNYQIFPIPVKDLHTRTEYFS